MANQVLSSVENNFTKGLVTEFTGLNFPENAATACDNCTFTIVGDITRRGGIDYELNAALATQNRAARASSSYRWNNVSGDGNTQILVEQVGEFLLFYRSSTATVASPLSAQLLGGVVNIGAFLVAGAPGVDLTLECQYADGNGYLFVYHPSCDPFYCTYIAGVVTGHRITVQIRDFTGVPEAGVSSNIRPTSLTVEHNYNLINQGWVSGNPWSTVSFTAVVVGLGSKTFTVAAGLPVVLGDQVTIIANHSTPGLPTTGPMMSGNVTVYAGTSMTINVTSGASGWFGLTGNDWLIIPRSAAYLNTWNAAVGNYPSNADVWWYFKNSSGAFDPATTLNNVSLGAGNAPRGHFILEAFSQQRDVVSNLAITDIQTNIRPKTGCWFQGRVWYTGLDAQQSATGDVDTYSWTENIYFSQIVNTVDDFGHCFQTNDPTSENLFDLLPTDGGVIQIQGCGSIFKLWPVQNGLLVFAGNGIWFITGSQGVGFSANDYTITKVSSVKITSNTSFVDVLGLPHFWNEEGIYTVTPPQQQGFGFDVQSLTYSTVDTFYNEIPNSSKKYARGDYDPINYVIQWIYRDTEASDVKSRYEFNKILNYNTATKAFFPYTIVSGDSGITVNTINYVTHPGGIGAPSPTFKYFCAKYLNPTQENTTFAEENNFSTYRDWAFVSGQEFTSYFVTGYKLHGQAQRRFQMPYILMYSRNEEPTSYKIQGIWDFANSGASGRYSTLQLIQINQDNYGMVSRRHRIRGQGLALQLKVTSVSGEPFDIMGWSAFETQNTGV